jgi:hypothetical protein
MEKTIPPFPFTVAGEEEKDEIKLQYQEIWHGEMPRRGREGTSGGGLRGAAAAALGQESPETSFGLIDTLCIDPVIFFERAINTYFINRE